MLFPISLLPYILAFSSCITPAYGSWFSLRTCSSGHAAKHIREIGETQHDSISSKSPLSASSLFSAPSARVILPSKTSQGVLVTSIVPKYEICQFPGSETQSCSTAYETVITSYCSTVLTAWFTKVTITDCEQRITFSALTTYSLVTTIPDPTPNPLLHGKETPSFSPKPVTYVQRIVSRYISPWQSLADGNPSDITVQVCETDDSGQEICTTIEEVWVIHSEDVRVTTTSSVLISESFKSPVIIIFGRSQSVTASAGDFRLTTEVEYSSLSANAITSISTNETPSNVKDLTTRTTVSTRTRTITGEASTITKTVDELETHESITTYTSTMTITSTITVQAVNIHNNIKR